VCSQVGQSSLRIRVPNGFVLDARQQLPPGLQRGELDRQHGERYSELLGQRELNTAYVEKAETPYAWRD
jgi:hypothetical protein